MKTLGEMILADFDAARPILEAWARGMRKAADIVDAKYAAGDMGNPGHHVLAAIPQGEK